jgi:aryl carrier-like protein
MQNNDTSTLTTAAPRDADVIADIWTAVLGCETCSRDVNFFELGGTSLKMMRIHAEAQRRLGIDVSIVEMFAYPTVNSFAVRLLQIRTVGASPQIVFPAPAKSHPLARAFRPMKPRS